MCGYMPRDNRCMWRMFVFMSVVVTVWGSVGIASVVENSGFLSLVVLKYVVCLCRG